MNVKCNSNFLLMYKIILLMRVPFLMYIIISSNAQNDMLRDFKIEHYVEPNDVNST